MRLFHRLVVRKSKLKLYAVTHISYICTILQAFMAVKENMSAALKADNGA